VFSVINFQFSAISGIQTDLINSLTGGWGFWDIHNHQQ